MSWPKGSQEIKWTTEISDGTRVCEECGREIPAGEEVDVRDGRPIYPDDPVTFHPGDCPPENVQ